MTNTRRTRLLAIATAALIVIGAMTALGARQQRNGDPIALSEALQLISDRKVDTVEIDDRHARARLELTDGTIRDVTFPSAFTDEFTGTVIAADTGVELSTPAVSALTFDMLFRLAFLGVLGFLVVFLIRRNPLNISGFAKGRGTEVDIPITRFDDVAGVDDVVADLTDVVDYLKDPGRYQRAGVTPPRGLLLVGPPGTGKTLAARATAGEAGVPFFAVAGSEFVETFVGTGARRVRDLFARARKHPKAIIFIDEIDAIGKKRTSGQSNGATEEREATLNQLLIEMDGFVGSNIVIIGATNRPDVLDPALLRPGRFDRQVTVRRPDRTARLALLELHFGTRRTDLTVDLAMLARRTAGLTGADIAYLANEAGVHALKAGSPIITVDHIEQAIGTVMLGRERPSAWMSDRDRQIVAWHEAGHAVAALTMDAIEDPVHLSIVPRGDSGGVTWTPSNDDAFITGERTRQQLVVLMAGRAAERELLNGEYTHGAAHDLAQATRIAAEMVARCGMMPGVLTTWPGSADLADLLAVPAIATQVEQILNDAMAHAVIVLDLNRAALEAIAGAALEDERLDAATLAALAADNGLQRCGSRL